MCIIAVMASTPLAVSNGCAVCALALDCCVLLPVLQAMSYTGQGGRSRMVVRLQLVNPVSAALAKLLDLKQGGALDSSPLAAVEEASVHDGDRPDSPGTSSDHRAALTAEASGAANAPRNKQ